MFRINFPKARFSRKLTLRPDFLVPRNCDWVQTLTVFLRKHLNDAQGYKVLSIQQLLWGLMKFQRLSERRQCAICTGKSDELFWKLNVGPFANSGPNGPTKILGIVSEVVCDWVE